LHPFWYQIFASFFMALFKVIALSTIAVAIVGREKNEAKRLRATTFAICSEELLV
jgi:hypothetical protein